MKAIVVDLNRCNGCFNCQLACKDEHCDNDWSPLAKPQPLTGQFWCKVKQEERGRVPVVAVDYTPTFCGMCDDAACMKAATGGAVYRREDGLVIIDPEKAKGQRQIVESCPLGMVYWNEELQIPQKCSGCAHLIDDGWKEPRCVDACFTGALRFGELEDFADELDAAQVAKELGQAGSHVYYLNKSQRWIAGSIADRSTNEVVIGANVSIADKSGTVIAALVSDDFGDFKYEKCAQQEYQVTIEAPGFQKIELKADCTEKDVVFDDIFVHVTA